MNLCQACNADVERVQGIYKVLQEITKKYNETREKIQEILRTKSRSPTSANQGVLQGTIEEENGDDANTILPICVDTGPRKLSPSKTRIKITCIKAPAPDSNEVFIKQEEESELENAENALVDDSYNNDKWPNLVSDADESDDAMEAEELQNEQLTDSLNETETRAELLLLDADDTNDEDDRFAALLDSDPDYKPESSTSSTVKIKINCSFCFRKFSSIALLKHHQRGAHNHGCLKCPWCDKNFVTRKLLKLHKQSAHEYENYSCPHCSKTFRSAKGLRAHISKVHEKNYTFSCHVCGKGFYNTLRLENHLFREHNIGQRRKEKKKLYHCPKEGCSKVLMRLSSLRAHVGRHEGKPAPYQCSLCPSNFFTKSNLCIHETQVHKLEPPEGPDGVRRHVPKCERCGKIFRTKPVLELHSKKCRKDDSIKCDLCDITFKTTSDLRTHQKFKHPEMEVAEPEPVMEKERQFQCSECGIAFTHKVGLRQHIRVLHKNEAVLCTICGVRKWNKLCMDIHLFHEHGIGEPRFRCDSCGKTFWHMMRKRRHVCNGILPPSSELKISACEICGKEFRILRNKIRHLRGVHKKEVAKKN